MSAGKRGLVLAGGGIRVAWQTGVVTALAEAGLTFDHGDGTSGGIFTLAMMLSGQSPDEMGERWRALDVRCFISALPIRSYLRSPTNWTALGGSAGIRDTVLPALGIDIDAIRGATMMTGAFNVADFTTKECVAIPHSEIDPDRLVAGVSLAGLMPAVDAGGRTWTDAVWIKDANLTDTVTRDCTEVWLAWCIGNTPRWGTGGLEQYVHMIEMSAVGGLTTELRWIADVNGRRAAGESVLGTTESVIVHVIKPQLPLPLDPDFIAGRIDAETLIAMGYRDASRYLATMSPQGVALTGPVTATPVRALGARQTFRAGGRLRDAGPASSTFVVEADDLHAIHHDPGGLLTAVGAFRHPTYGYRLFSAGTVRLSTLDGGTIVAEAALMLGGQPHRLVVTMPLPGRRWLGDVQQTWELYDDAGTLVDSGGGSLSWRQRIGSVASFEPSGAHSLSDRVTAARLAVRVCRGLSTPTRPSRIAHEGEVSAS